MGQYNNYWSIYLSRLYLFQYFLWSILDIFEHCLVNLISFLALNGQEDIYLSIFLSRGYLIEHCLVLIISFFTLFDQ